MSQKLNLPFEKAFCKGCRNGDGIIRAIGKTEPCKVYKCISEKGFELCSECKELPCDNLQPFADFANIAPHNTKLFHLFTIRKDGFEKWLKKAKTIRDNYFNKKFEI